jgi:hypothetical protein
LLEGPQTDGVTIGDKGECVITPSTDLKFDPGLKGKSKLNYLRNYWLLIGKSLTWWRTASWWAEASPACLLLFILNIFCTVQFKRVVYYFQGE